MLERYLLASLAAAVVMMIWGAVWWAVSPVGFMVMEAAPDEAVVALLSDTLREKGQGVYFYPFASEREAGDPAALEAFRERHRRGPLVQIFYQPQGGELMSPKIFLGGFIHLLASSLLVGALLLMAAPALPTYSRRVLFVFLAGTFAGVVVELGKPIWFYHAWDYSLYAAFFHITGWLLAGLAMAAILKPGFVVMANAHPDAGPAAG